MTYEVFPIKGLWMLVPALVLWCAVTDYHASEDAEERRDSLVSFGFLFICLFLMRFLP